jgi:hypothetical protein
VALCRGLFGVDRPHPLGVEGMGRPFEQHGALTGALVDSSAWRHSASPQLSPSTSHAAADAVKEAARLRALHHDLGYVTGDQNPGTGDSARAVDTALVS